MTTKRNDEAAPVEVSAGPRVPPAALTHVTDAFGVLQRYAPRPITRITVRVTKSHDPGSPELVRIGANLSVGDHLLRAEGTAAALGSAVDLVCDRLRRQLTNLPHGRRGDYVPHHRAAR